MRLFAYLFVSALLFGCAGSRHFEAADAAIDTTSWDTMSKGINAAKREDRQIVGKIPCDLGHKLGLDPLDSKQRELLLQQLRVQFQGKTVAQVAAEVRAEQKSESDKLEQFANRYLREHQKCWKERGKHISSVTKGTKEEDVLKGLGKPDAASGTGATKSWLYWIDASVKDGQICKEMIVMKFENGVLESMQQSIGYRRSIADIYKESHNSRDLTLP